jgi:putative endonuclease
MGEIDIIARDGDVLAFVEVKTRFNESYGGAVAAVGRHKQRRIICAASLFLAATQCDLPARFDVITVSRDETCLLRDAFRGDEICSAG